MAALQSFSSSRLMVPPLLIFIVGSIIAGATTLLFALPLTLWLRKRGRLSALLLCSLGAIMGAAVYAGYAFDSSYYPQMNDRDFALWAARQAALRAALPGAVFGFLSSVALCVGAGITIRSSRTQPATRAGSA
jgi:hypothetical protein